jgi:hypothetical protein
MRKRFGVLLALAFALTAFAPVAVDAGGNAYTYKVMRNYCYGDHGYSVYFKVKESAKGYSPANYMTIGSSAEARNVGSNSWFTVYTWNKAAYSFHRDGRNHYLTVWRSYVGNNSQYHRIVMYLKVWNGNTLLASKTLRSVSC